MLRLGFDIGGMNIRACLLDNAGTGLRAQTSRPFPKGKGEQAFVDELAEMAHELLAPLGASPENVDSVGIGIPGTVDRGTGVLVSACNLHLNGMPIRAHAQALFPNARIDVANDADVAALAEAKLGAFRGYDSALLITIGTGIGGGLVLGGKLFRGGRGLGCELGHITLQHGGPMCTCGNRGCAETLCSATWLERQGRHCLLDYPMSRIAVAAEGRSERVTARIVLEEAREGDGIARQIVDAYIENLSSLVTTCCYAYNPEIIGLGGGVSNAGDVVLGALTERVNMRARSYRPGAIVTAALGDAAGMIGAALLPETE